jgi:hypothetical protein
MVGSDVLQVDYPNFRLQAFWTLSSNGTGFSPIISPFSCCCYSTSVPKSSSATCCLTKTNRRTSAFLEMGWGGRWGEGIRQKITFTLDFTAVSCFRLNSTSYRGSLGSVTLLLYVRFMVEEVTLGRAFLTVVRSPLSHTFNKYSIFILIFILLLPKGQADE